MALEQKHPGYSVVSHRWKLMRQLADGQDAIKAAGEEYHPAYSGMYGDPDLLAAWQADIKRTYLFASTQRTIEAFTGLVTRVEPELELPDEMMSFTDDVTFSGASLSDFTDESVEEQLTVTRGGILVDQERGPGRRVSRFQAKRLGQRPTWTYFRAEDILDWQYETIGELTGEDDFVRSRRLLTFVLLADNDFERTTLTSQATVRRRFLELTLSPETGHYQIRHLDENGTQLGEPTVPTIQGAPFEEIPFFILGGRPGSEDITVPVFLNLGHANIAHYQTMTDYRHGLHITANPTPYIFGIKDENQVPKTIGPIKPWWSTDHNAKTGFLEYEGKGLESHERALEHIEGLMAALGAEVLQPDRVQRTATETVIKNAGRNSKLARLANATSSTILSALKLTARWMGLPEQDIHFKLSTDYMPAPISAQELTALVQAVLAGKLSDQEFFDLLKTGELVDRSKTFEDHQREIEESLPDGIEGDEDEPPVLTDDESEEDEGSEAEEDEEEAAE